MGWPTGFEPATTRSTIWGSNQAELRPPANAREANFLCSQRQAPSRGVGAIQSGGQIFERSGAVCRAQEAALLRNPTPTLSMKLRVLPSSYLFSPVGTSRSIGPRTVPVRSGLSGAQTADFS